MLGLRQDLSGGKPVNIKSTLFTTQKICGCNFVKKTYIIMGKGRQALLNMM